MDFINTPTTNDDAGYLLDSTAHNTCAQPYGVEFTLVNQAYTDTSAPAAGSSWNLVSKDEGIIFYSLLFFEAFSLRPTYLGNLTSPLKENLIS